jgi:hypothetical protein
MRQLSIPAWHSIDLNFTGLLSWVLSHTPPKNVLVYMHGMTLLFMHRYPGYCHTHLGGQLPRSPGMYIHVCVHVYVCMIIATPTVPHVTKLQLPHSPGMYTHVYVCMFMTTRILVGSSLRVYTCTNSDFLRISHIRRLWLIRAHTQAVAGL